MARGGGGPRRTVDPLDRRSGQLTRSQPGAADLHKLQLPRGLSYRFCQGYWQRVWLQCSVRSQDRPLSAGSFDQQIADDLVIAPSGWRG